MIKSVLEVDSVQKHYNGNRVVSDVYIKCKTGDIIGLLGRNGSGKSTLLKIIFGIVPADFKMIKVNGSVKNKTKELLKDISYLHQEQFIPNHFSVRKAIFLSLKKDKISLFEEDQMIQTLLDKKIKQLSSGELRYLEIKIILSNESKFTLLDEPYNGLSPIMVDKINDLIVQNSIRKGIIITDHNYENVIKISNSLLLMDNGKTHQINHKSQLVEKGYLSIRMI